MMNFKDGTSWSPFNPTARTIQYGNRQGQVQALQAMQQGQQAVPYKRNLVDKLVDRTLNGIGSRSRPVNKIPF